MPPPGFSDATPLKWQRLDRFLREIHLVASKSILERQDAMGRGRWLCDTYAIVDLYAGPGDYGHDVVGSPLIAMKAAADSGINFHAWLVEPVHHEMLATAVASHGLADRCTIIATTFEKAMDRLKKEIHRCTLGFAFVDPNGYPAWRELRTFADNFRSIDLMINVNATAHKRCLKCPAHKETMRPSERLHSVGKKSMCLWRPADWDNWQFCLAYLTNGPTFEARKQGFHLSHTRSGLSVIRLIDYTEAERKIIRLPGILPGFEEAV